MNTFASFGASIFICTASAACGVGKHTSMFGEGGVRVPMCRRSKQGVVVGFLPLVKESVWLWITAELMTEPGNGESGRNTFLSNIPPDEKASFFRLLSCNHFSLAETEPEGPG